MGATHRTLRRLELALAMAGAACVVWVAAWWAVPAWYQSRMTGELNRAQAIEIVGGDTVLPAPEAMLSPEAAATDAEDTGPLGVLEIPRLAVSVAVLRGEDDRTLALGAGHLADTALPWEGGNTALAGHRDTHFRPLRHLAVGDELRFVTFHGTFHYRVHRIRVVEPTDVSVLRADGEVALTLITCYPFRFIGAAPRRYIVQAARLR